jgi:hypothetical protein
VSDSILTATSQLCPLLSLCILFGSSPSFVHSGASATSQKACERLALATHQPEPHHRLQSLLLCSFGQPPKLKLKSSPLDRPPTGPEAFEMAENVESTALDSVKLTEQRQQAQSAARRDGPVRDGMLGPVALACFATFFPLAALCLQGHLITVQVVSQSFEPKWDMLWPSLTGLSSFVLLFNDWTHSRFNTVGLLKRVHPVWRIGPGFLVAANGVVSAVWMAALYSEFNP